MDWMIARWSALMRIITRMNGLLKALVISLPCPGSEEYGGCKADYVYAGKGRGHEVKSNRFFLPNGCHPCDK